MSLWKPGQPCVVHLKNPVNESFDQPELVTKKCKTQKIGWHTREGLGGDREMWAAHREKGARG